METSTLTGRKQILFVSGSLGLGHITRDVALADALRHRNPNVDVWWLAGEPAKTYLENRKESMVDEAQHCGSETDIAESVSSSVGLNLISYTWKAKGEWLRTIKTFKQVMSRCHFDMVIGDETYEIALALSHKLVRIDVPFIMIYDFVGLDSPTKNPLHLGVAYILNLLWSMDHRLLKWPNMGLFVGEPDDIPDMRMGFMLPNRKRHAEKHYTFIGYILGFDPKAYRDRDRLRRKLGYGDEPLIVCTVGGTSIGKGLLELCGNAYKPLKKKLGNLHMELVCGPRINPATVHVPSGVSVRGFIPRVYEHLAASDLAVVLGGGTTTLELTALRVPFLYFPLEGHTEQEIDVAGRLTRHGAGTRMTYSKTGPETLAQTVVEHLNREVTWHDIPTNGAEMGAQTISNILV
jgi:UDP-N-acetylglucosamine:LPS N-acetylglucosamine transferase